MMLFFFYFASADEAVVSAAGGAVASIAVEVVLAGVVVGLSGFVVDPVFFCRVSWGCAVGLLGSGVIRVVRCDNFTCEE